MEINGLFLYNKQPMNGARAKLWRSAGFASAPEFDDAEPGAGFQVGGILITGVQYGFDGAFRFADVPSGDYYVSVEYDNHRAWIKFGEVKIHAILTNEEDMLIRRGGVPARLPIGPENSKFTIVAGQIIWV